jgi:hypothetical protein
MTVKQAAGTGKNCLPAKSQPTGKESRMISRLARRMRIPAAIAALTLAAGLLGTAAGPASAAPSPHHAGKLAHGSPARTAHSRAGIVSGSMIFNYHSGLCLGISGDKNDQPAVQWNCNGHADQEWHIGAFYPDGSGFFQLVNGNNSCLGVAGGSTNEGARVVGWSCYGPTHPDQYWSPLPYYCDGDEPLQNLGSDYVLGVAGNSTQWGAPVVQWAFQFTCNNQYWSDII